MQKWLPKVDQKSAAGAAFAVIFIAFFFRFGLAPSNSYWLDEILSVAIYGAENESLLDMVSKLAQKSIHPPLYQGILYIWISLFGPSELATRSLSNIYIAGATLCIYYLCATHSSKRRAIAVIILFSVMATSIRFSLEARSYAQSIFLVCLSSLALYNFLKIFEKEYTWKNLILRKWTIALLFANTALILTHYYNIFFLVSQGLFLTGYILSRYKLHRIYSNAALTAFLYIFPVAVLLAVWWPALMRGFARHSGGHLPKEGVTRNAAEIPFRMVFEPNVYHAFWVAIAVGALLLAFYIGSIRRFRVGADYAKVARSFDFYYLLWFVGPSLFAFAVFTILGQERYVGRYFAISAPGLAFVLVMAFEQAVKLTRPFLGSKILRAFVSGSTIAACIFAAAIAGPDGYRAATGKKTDIRGIARQIVDTAANDPAHKYVLYEINFRPSSLLNFYLARSNTKLRVRHFVTQSDERKDKFSFAEDMKKFEGGEKIVIIWPHRSSKEYPNTIRTAQHLFTESYRSLNRQGNGFIVFTNDK